MYDLHVCIHSCMCHCGECMCVMYVLSVCLLSYSCAVGWCIFFLNLQSEYDQCTSVGVLMRAEKLNVKIERVLTCACVCVCVCVCVLLFLE